MFAIHESSHSKEHVYMIIYVYISVSRSVDFAEFASKKSRSDRGLPMAMTYYVYVPQGFFADQKNTQNPKPRSHC